MSLTGYLLEKYNCMGSAYTCRRLCEEAEQLGIDLRMIGLHDCLLTEEGFFNGSERLEKRDFLINRYKWGKLRIELNGLAARCYNDCDGFGLFVNKYEQVKRLRSDAFLIPKYVLGTGLMPFSSIVQRLGLPFVAKGLESSMGREVFLIGDREAFVGLSERFGGEKEWLFQEFIAQSAGRDLRLFCVRGDIVGCMERRSHEDFRSNVALGASVTPVTVTVTEERIGRELYEQTGLDFMGIDLLFGDDKPYFCEINVMPGIEGMEEASGKNLARLILETIRGDF